MWKYLRIFSKRDWLIFKAMLWLLKKPELQMLSTDSQRCTLVEVTKPRNAFISRAVTGRQPSSEPNRSWNFLAYMLVWVTMFWMQLSGTKSWKKSKAVAVAGIFWAGPVLGKRTKVKCYDKRNYADWQTENRTWDKSHTALSLTPSFLTLVRSLQFDWLCWVEGFFLTQWNIILLSCHLQSCVGCTQAHSCLYKLQWHLKRILRTVT